MKAFRGGIIGFVLGGLLLGAAGVGTSARAPQRPVPLDGVNVPASLRALASAPTGEQLPGGEFLVGAAKASIAPDPTLWKPDVPSGTCQTVNPDPGCLQTFDMLWAKSVREPGVFIRATAISNGRDTVLFAVGDVVGWFDSYPSDICGDCGSRAIRTSLETELGVPASNIVIASTHTHASGNTLADIPLWYYEQVRDAIKTALRGAYASLRPAVIDVGSTTSRYNNEDRRIVARAVPDYEVQWMRATDANGDTVATVYNFAAHPTVLAANDTLHAGYPGAASRRLEQELPGDDDVAMFFPSGLGNQKVIRSRGIDGLGNRLAEAVLRDMQESPRRLRTNDIKADIRQIAIPGDNLVLIGARGASIFVRDILPPAGGGPATGRWGKNDTMPACVGGGPLTVNTTIGGFRIGETAWMISPGEIFSSISLVVKDYLEKAEVVFVFGLANDQLGYLIPYNEFDETAHQGPGLAANSSDTSEYEEVLSLGRCAGEQVMDELIASGRTLGFTA